MTLFIGILEQGFIYGIMALGAYITYKILDFPDLTVDGSFPLGAAVTVALISRGVNPYLTFPIAALCGAQGERSSVRHHHDDRPLHHQLPDRRQIQCADVQYENGI